MRYLELLIFILFISFFIFKINIKIFRKIFFLILYIFSFLDLACILCKKEHINYSFLININKENILLVFKYFKKELCIFLFFFILIIFLVLKYESKVYKLLKKINIKIYCVILISLGIFSFKENSVLFSLKNLFKVSEFYIENENINSVFNKIGVSKNNFISNEELVASKGKNIVVIYLESIEKNFLGRGLTPNLDKIKNEWNFYENYNTNQYSSWTMGAIYSTQTSFPTIFGLKDGNEILKDATENEGISLGNVLNKANYNQVFLGGASLDYAGKGNFFRLNNYEVFGNEEWNKKYPRNSWGIYDYDLFNEAKRKYVELSKKNRPFNLTILTVDTHFPNGYPDERLREKINSDKKDMEYCIQVTDYLVGDFINFLKEQDNYKETAIFILPDHLMMGNEETSPIIKSLNSKNRKLFILTNQLNIKDYEDNKKELYFFDIPKLILNASRVKTNAKFLKDIIPNINIKFIEENIINFSKINRNFYKIKEEIIKSDLKIRRRTKNKFKVKIYNGSKELNDILLSENKIAVYPFNKNFSIQSFYITDKNNMELKREYGDLFLGITLEKEEIVMQLFSPKLLLKEMRYKNYKIYRYLKMKIFNYNLLKELSLVINTIYKNDDFKESMNDLKELKEENIFIIYFENNKINILNGKGEFIYKNSKLSELLLKDDINNKLKTILQKYEKLKEFKIFYDYKNNIILREWL